MPPAGAKNGPNLEPILPKHLHGLDDMTLQVGHAATHDKIEATLAESKIELRGDPLSLDSAAGWGAERRAGAP